MKILLTRLVICLSLIFLTGCVVNRGEFSFASTKQLNVPIKKKGERVRGLDCNMVFFVPFGLPDLDIAIDRALQNAGPEYDALIDVVVNDLRQQFLIGRICFEVEGTPVRTKDLSIKWHKGKDPLFNSKRIKRVSFEQNIRQKI